MYSKVKALSIIFGVSEGEIKKVIDEKGDLYQAIAEETGMTREQVKHWAHGVMYSTGPESFNIKEEIKDV